MGKEAKLGVALILVLLGAFGLALYKRMKDLQPAADPLAAADQIKSSASTPEKPKLSSGPLKSKPLAQAPADDTQQSPPGAASSYGDSRPATTTPDSSTSSDAASGARDPFVNSSQRATNSRYADRYGSNARDIYGPTTAAASSEPTSTTAAEQVPTATVSSDPFNRYGNRATSATLTPTGDASAALMPASATSENLVTVTPPPIAANPQNDVEEPESAETPRVAEANPLRSTSERTEPLSTSRSTGPGKYDLYAGTTPTVEPADEPAPSSASSRVRFNPSNAGSRYSSEPTEAAAEQKEPTVPSERPANSRYSLPATTSDGTINTASNPPRGDASRTGWSGTSSPTHVTGGPSHGASTSAAASTIRSDVPIATNVPPRSTRAIPAAAPTRGDTYVVLPNDSFSTISERVYGTSSYFKALQEHNRAKYPRPDLLRANDVVATPPVETLQLKYPALCPRPNHLPLPGRSSGLTSQRSGGRVYVVEEGDTLFDIARFELGKATRWVEIYELNKDLIGEDFNHLRPGTQLSLPSETVSDSFTRRPGATISR